MTNDDFPALPVEDRRYPSVHYNNNNTNKNNNNNNNNNHNNHNYNNKK
jgi:hypothetical protein